VKQTEWGRMGVLGQLVVVGGVGGE
jgi:hypothetical protein